MIEARGEMPVTAAKKRRRQQTRQPSILRICPEQRRANDEGGCFLAVLPTDRVYPRRHSGERPHGVEVPSSPRQKCTILLESQAAEDAFRDAENLRGKLPGGGRLGAERRGVAETRDANCWRTMRGNRHRKPTQPRLPATHHPPLHPAHSSLQPCPRLLPHPARQRHRHHQVVMLPIPIRSAGPASTGGLPSRPSQLVSRNLPMAGPFQARCRPLSAKNPRSPRLLLRAKKHVFPLEFAHPDVDASQETNSFPIMGELALGNA